MKIELGPGGKIIGTKRVSGNGQVSGLTEYAGQEVLIILPGSSTEVISESQNFISELQRVVHEQMRLAFRRYKSLRESYLTPTLATNEFMKNLTPKIVQNVLKQIDTWVREQTEKLESKLK